MKIYKTQSEVEKDIKAGVLTVNEDVRFECSISIEAKIIVQGDINARDINAWDIDAGNINARNIKYYAACLAYQNITCTSIVAKRDKHCDPVCLDGKLTIKPKEYDEVVKAIALLEAKGRLKNGKILN